MGRTLYDKIWDEHVVHTEEDGTSILYIDRHLVHEVTIPQAFEGLREAGRKVWRISSIVATADHNTPTTGWERGYDGIADQVCAALSDVRTTAVVMKINSPGGEVAGCFEAVRVMREAAARAGKPLVAYADEMALSGGYALACAASSIFLPPLGQVGSVGAISVLRDRTKMNEEIGLKVVVVRSGTRKAEGHPDIAITQEMIDREQVVIDRMGRTFADVVSAARGVSTEKVLAHEADVLWGPDAVAARLADDVCTFTECLARAAALGMKTTAARAAAATRKTMDDFAKRALGLLNTDNPDEALGRLSAWKDSHERLPAVSAELATLRTAAAATTEAQREAKAKADREAVVAEGERTMKVTPAEAAQIRAGEGWLGGQSTEQLRAMVAERRPLADLAAPQPKVGKIAVPTTPAAQAGEVTLSAREIEIARQMGNDPDEVLATKRANLGLPPTR